MPFCSGGKHLGNMVVIDSQPTYGRWGSTPSVWPTMLQAAKRGARSLVWFGLFVLPLSHICNIGHVNYRSHGDTVSGWRGTHPTAKQ